MPPGVRRPEGPFGDHYGYYSLRHDYPVFEVDAIAHRRDAIYPATVVGKPRQEDFFIGDLLQELLSPLFPLVMPAVRAPLVVRRDRLPLAGGGGRASSATAREAMASAFRILGEGQLSLTKFLLLTDRPVDLRDFRATLEHVLARTRPETDLYVFANLSMDTLDYTGPRVNEGSKGVWLGLGRSRARAAARVPPRRRLPPDVTDVRVFCGGCLVVGGPPFADGSGRGAAPRRASRLRGLAARRADRRAAARRRAARSTSSGRRSRASSPPPTSTPRRRDLVRNHVAYAPPVLIDARLKPGFPERALLRRGHRGARSPAAGGSTSRPVEMGDSGPAHLDPG